MASDRHFFASSAVIDDEDGTALAHVTAKESTAIKSFWTVHSSMADLDSQLTGVRPK
jgi:hypothetical protein